jgi:hypothetical protein
MLKDLIEYIQKEWSIFKKAPFTFVFLIILIFSLSFAILRAYYSETVQNLKGFSATLKDRLEIKDS